MIPTPPHKNYPSSSPAGLLDVSNGATGAHANNCMTISTGFIPVTLPAVRVADCVQTPGQDAPETSDLVKAVYNRSRSGLTSNTTAIILNYQTQLMSASNWSMHHSYLTHRQFIAAGVHVPCVTGHLEVPGLHHPRKLRGTSNCAAMYNEESMKNF